MEKQQDPSCRSPRNRGFLSRGPRTRVRISSMYRSTILRTILSYPKFLRISPFCVATFCLVKRNHEGPSGPFRHPVKKGYTHLVPDRSSLKCKETHDARKSEHMSWQVFPQLHYLESYRTNIPCVLSGLFNDLKFLQVHTNARNRTP